MPEDNKSGIESNGSVLPKEELSESLGRCRGYEACAMFELHKVAMALREQNIMGSV